MAHFPMDLSKFKKVAQDKHSTTLQHPKGHEIKVAHASLSPKLRDTLASIPLADDEAKMKGGGEVQATDRTAHRAIVEGRGFDDGGEVDSPNKYAPQVSESDSSSGGLSASDLAKLAPMVAAAMSKGGQVKGYAQGAEVEEPAAPDEALPLAATPPDSISSERPSDPTLEQDLESIPKESLQKQAYDKKRMLLAQTYIAPGTEGMTEQERAESPQIKNLALDALERESKAQDKQDNASDKKQQQSAATQAKLSQRETALGIGAPESPAPSPDSVAASQSSTSPSEFGSASATPVSPGSPSARAPSSSTQSSEGDAEEQEPSSPVASALPQNPLQIKQSIHNELSTEDAAFQHDLVNGHITPETYSSLFAKKDTLGKIGSIFGMLLGGASSGITGQANPALKMMQDQISNDLEAQKQSKTNAQNYVKLNLQHQFQKAQIAQMQKQGVLSQAEANNLNAEANAKSYALANMQMNRAALHKLTTDIQAMPPGSPQRVQAENMLAMMYKSVDSENYNIADRAASAGALFSGVNGGGAPGSMDQTLSALRIHNPEMAKEVESRLIPGVGIASVPLPLEARDKILAKQQLGVMTQDLANWSQKHSGSIDPKIIAEGRTKAAELQSMYRNSINGGVFKAGEQSFIDKIIDSKPTEFFNSIRVLPKLNEVIRSNAVQLKLLKNSYGVRDMPGGVQQQQAAPQFKTVNGIKYTRGPNGEAVPVK